MGPGWDAKGEGEVTSHFRGRGIKKYYSVLTASLSRPQEGEGWGLTLAWVADSFLGVSGHGVVEAGQEVEDLEPVHSVGLRAMVEYVDTS